MKRLGNSRLLYLEQDAIDLAQAMGKIDSFIDSSVQIELSVEAILVYPKEGKFLVGREVTGYPTELPTGVKMLDIAGREVFEGRSEAKENSYEEVLKKAKELSEAQGGRLYRLVFKSGNFLDPLTQWTMDS